MSQEGADTRRDAGGKGRERAKRLEPNSVITQSALDPKLDQDAQMLLQKCPHISAWDSPGMCLFSQHINNSLFHFQTCPSLDDKLYDHFSFTCHR